MTNASCTASSSARGGEGWIERERGGERDGGKETRRGRGGEEGGGGEAESETRVGPLPLPSSSSSSYILHLTTSLGAAGQGQSETDRHQHLIVQLITHTWSRRASTTHPLSVVTLPYYLLHCSPLDKQRHTTPDPTMGKSQSKLSQEQISELEKNTRCRSSRGGRGKQ